MEALRGKFNPKFFFPTGRDTNYSMTKIRSNKRTGGGFMWGAIWSNCPSTPHKQPRYPLTWRIFSLLRAYHMRVGGRGLCGQMVQRWKTRGDASLPVFKVAMFHKINKQTNVKLEEEMTLKFGEKSLFASSLLARSSSCLFIVRRIMSR